MDVSAHQGQGTADAILILRQMQEKHCAAKTPFTFVDLEKAFDRVSTSEKGTMVGLEKSGRGGVGC